MVCVKVIKRRRNVYFSTFIVTLFGISHGLALTWTSPTMPRLMEPNPILVITAKDNYYITSANPIGTIFGQLVSGLLTANIGRKWTIFVITLLYVVHWILLGLAWSANWLTFARFISGILMGLSLPTFPMYIAEISEADIRGPLNSLTHAARSLGFLLDYAIGPFVPYMYFIYVGAVLPAILLVLVFFLPETPYFLISKGCKTKALKTLCWLRNSEPEDVHDEFERIKSAVEEGNADKTSMLRLMKKPADLKAICLCAAGRFALSSCGFFTILINMESIFIAANVPSSIGCIVVGSVILLSSMPGPLVNRFYGYKKPLIGSLTALSLVLGTLGFYFFLLEHGYVIYPWLRFVPVLCLMVHAVLISFGVMNTVFALPGEMFSPKVRPFGSAITNTFGSVVTYVLVTYYFIVKDIAGLSTVFWTLATLTLLTTLFHFVFLPETSRLTLEEIHETLKNPLLKRKKAEVILDSQMS